MERAECIYCQKVVLQPAWLEGNDKSRVLVDAIHEAGDFELFYGVPENEENLSKVSIAKPMFYNILYYDHFVGYIGFHKVDSAYEVEIYVLQRYRRLGFAKAAINAALRAAFDGDICGMEAVDRIVSSVRADNTSSIELMKRVGFTEDKTKSSLQLFLSNDISESDDESECYFLPLSFFYITREDMRPVKLYSKDLIMVEQTNGSLFADTDLTAAVRNSDRDSLSPGIASKKALFDEELCIFKHFVILDKEHHIIGCVGISGESLYEVYVIIKAEYQRRGYGTQAIITLLQTMFKGGIRGIDKADVPVILAVTKPQETGTQKFLESIGFERTDSPPCIEPLYFYQIKECMIKEKL